MQVIHVSSRLKSKATTPFGHDGLLPTQNSSGTAQSKKAKPRSEGNLSTTPVNSESSVSDISLIQIIFRTCIYL